MWGLFNFVMMRSTILAVILGSTTVLCGCDKPRDTAKVFGVRMGDPISSLKGVRKDSDPRAQGWYYFTPTEPNSVFSEYMAFATQKDGVCEVDASGDQPIEKSQTLALLNVLISKYGKPYQDRTLYFYWQNGPIDPDAKLPDTLKMIALWNGTFGGPGIEYQFTNIDDCLKDAKSEGL